MALDNMNALVCVEPNRFEYRMMPIPKPQADQVLVKILQVGICGTDYHAFKGNQPFFDYPRILGHEVAVQIVDGGDGAFVKGELATFMPYLACGICIACRTGRNNCCAAMQVAGVHIDGALRNYMVVPSHLLIKAGSLTVDQLVLVEPLAIGAHGVRRADVKNGEYVLVMGAGPIGLATMQFAIIAGAEVIALDVNDDRLDFCRRYLGVNHVINPKRENVKENLMRITGGDMPTVVLDATGNKLAIHEGFDYLAHGARYVLIGLQKEMLSFSHPEFHRREATLMSSRNATKEDFTHVTSCLSNGLINSKSYISHRIAFEDLAGRFESLSRSDSQVIKAVVEF
ncbi:zinc-binding alcohol dehydrogenase family protein [Sphingobacterium bambusae]|uniref:Zinc-binding alcohol dehydrogenase family protein n=1 Tax=Sphingobacterium bambusae TaxID=662858 RepID=A0ABW6BJM3_9SPHI|nr:zinc-binding alcohol dehydrogenase family protein [Sphingobacterium bambusae]WPL49472.1 zinc-binding alcohol dehydrogenase family protein [Sphingobacterium bambusae]